MALQVFTGSRVSDGIVVFMDGDGGWTEAIARSGLIADDETMARMTEWAETAAADAVVVDPYPIEVSDEGTDIRPVRYRERIRAYGPSVHPEFAKAPAHGHFDGGR